MGLYDELYMDPNLEQTGALIYLASDTRVLITRAGGSNENFGKEAAKRLAPYQKVIATNAMPMEKLKRLMIELYVDCVIKNWEVQIDGEWKSGLIMPDGFFAAKTRENLIALLSDPGMHVVWERIVQAAAENANFRRENVEAAAKN